jgi:predicted Holliday junction resolvase-like endonuclease
MVVEIVAITIFLALLLLFIGYLVGKKIGVTTANKRWEEKLPKLKQEALEKSRAVIGGLFSEQLAPYLPDFPYKPTEVRFIGKPIDFIVFKGMDERKPSKVVFVEVKSGKSDLSPIERQLKKLIDGKKVCWEEYRIPEDITSKKV